MRYRLIAEVTAVYRTKTYPWIKHLQEHLPAYLERLARKNRPGAFLPCEQGATEIGRTASLGFSCFALKIYYTIGRWDTLPQSEKTAWIAFIQSYQKGALFFRGAFVDPPVYGFIQQTTTFRAWLFGRFLSRSVFSDEQRLIYAETKQAIATLAQVGEHPRRPYRGFPKTPEAVQQLLAGLDWTQPWGAGGQAACLAVFLRTQAPVLWEATTCQALQKSWLCFVEKLADKTTGGYFQGTAPALSDLVNGAMKIITGLDWLDEPIHYPEALIDTCLQYAPPAAACYMVNAVYVLYRCLQQTAYKQDKVQQYCTEMLERIRIFYNPDGGFSYWVGKTQTHYYNVPISNGLPESDIHGTCLLTWALAMIFSILNEHESTWRVIKP